MSYKIKLTIDGAERDVQCFTTNYFLINPTDKMLISPESAEGKKITSDFLSGHSKLSSAEYYAWKYASLDGFNKNLPWNSMPNNKAIAGGSLTVILESTSDDDPFYFGLKDKEMYNGSLEVFISKKDEDIPFRKIEFWDAYIVDISEYAGKNEEAMYMGCVISPGIVRYNKKIIHKKPWHVTDIDKKLVAGNPIEELKKEEIECTLNFRRPKDYDGSFAFDWWRTGDTGEHGDRPYSEIMLDIPGYTKKQQAQDFIDTQYTKFTQEWKKQHPKYKQNYVYVVPWASIMHKQTINLRLKCEEEQGCEKIELRFEKPEDSNCLTLNFTEIPANKAGVYYNKTDLKVTCVKKFSNNITLNAYAGETLVGRIIFLKNAKTYPINITLITVKTWIKGTNANTGEEEYKKTEKEPTKQVEERIARFLQQAYIEPVFSYANLDLSEIPKAENRIGSEYIYFPSDTSGAEGSLEVNDWSKNRTLFAIFFKNNTKKRINTGDRSGKYKFGSIHNFLHLMFHKQNPNLRPKLNSAYKMYFFAEKGHNYGQEIDGQASIANKALIIFNDHHNNDTPIHEISHCFGLNHIFMDEYNRDSDKYKFAKHKTDNLMDYEEKKSPKKRFSLWYWQIKEIWEHLKNDKL